MPPQDGQRQLLVLGGARLAEAFGKHEALVRVLASRRDPSRLVSASRLDVDSLSIVDPLLDVTCFYLVFLGWFLWDALIRVLACFGFKKLIR